MGCSWSNEDFRLRRSGARLEVLAAALDIQVQSSGMAWAPGFLA